jgi:hypothetical protein
MTLDRSTAMYSGPLTLKPRYSQISFGTENTRFVFCGVARYVTELVVIPRTVAVDVFAILKLLSSSLSKTYGGQLHIIPFCVKSSWRFYYEPIASLIVTRDEPHKINAGYTLERFRTGRLIDEAAAAAVAH